jgi:hypothetical protein
MWMLNTITDDELLDHCGLDALCLFRTLKMGWKLCLLGIFNSIWLMPLYATADTSPETEATTDFVVRITVSHLPPESPRLVATVVAAYMLFGFTMVRTVMVFLGFPRSKRLHSSYPGI